MYVYCHGCGALVLDGSCLLSLMLRLLQDEVGQSMKGVENFEDDTSVSIRCLPFLLGDVCTFDVQIALNECHMYRPVQCGYLHRRHTSQSEPEHCSCRTSTCGCACSSHDVPSLFITQVSSQISPQVSSVDMKALLNWHQAACLPTASTPC